MAEWAIDTQPIDVTTASFELKENNTKLVVSNNGVAFDEINIKRGAMAMEVVGNFLFRRHSSALPSNAWKTTAQPQAGNISVDIKSTGVQGGATRWFFIIGEGDIRNGLTVKMHSIEDRKVELFSDNGVFTVSRH